MLILHAADLHLSLDESAYTLGVLTEIVSVAARERAEALLLAGDVFDSFQDMQRLHAEMASALDALPPSCAVLYIPGNHEYLRAPQAALDAMRRMSLGRALLVTAEPFSVIPPGQAGGAEIVAVPHQASYTDYVSWEVPARKADQPRVVLAHAALTGASYLGPDTEEVASVMDTDLLARLGADYAAMGHLHTPRTVRIGDVTVSYPGSARVWRRGETGPRSVCLARLEGGTVRVDRAILATAGQYRLLPVAMDLEARIPDMDPEAATWGPRDVVDIELSGVVEDENAAVRARDALTERYRSRVRVLEVRLASVASLAGISRNGLAARYVAAWRARERDLVAAHGPEVARRVLRAGLEKIRAALEARKTVAG